MSRTTSHIAKDIDTVLDLYEAICFNITAVHGDKKFNIKTLKAHLLPIFKHIYSKEENVGTIKRIIRIIKKTCKMYVRCNFISVLHRANNSIIDFMCGENAEYISN